MSTLPKDGGPAFPTGFQPTHCEPEHGMSLRDYFAGQALGVAWKAFDAGYCGDDELPTNQALAECAYQMADAMLAARAMEAK